MSMLWVSREKTLDLVVIDTYWEGIPGILWELMIHLGFKSVLSSFPVRDVTPEIFGFQEFSERYSVS